MNILFGADAIRYPLTGIGRYAFELASRLPNSREIDSVCYFRDGKVSTTLQSLPDVTEPISSKGRFSKFFTHVPFLIGAYKHYAAIKQSTVLSKYSNYIYHGPNYYLPAHKGPRVATFHDLSVYKWPECAPSWRIRYMRQELPLTLKRANILITDSEFTRHELASYFNWPISRIVAAPLAASADYHPMSHLQTSPALKHFNLQHGAYTLFVGTMDPRKNIDVLLNAYDKLPAKLRIRFPLVVVGYEGWKSERTIARLRSAEREGWARYLGFVDELSLPFLYAGARVFVYPSRYEGFGLPVLEAMQSGVPVICSNAASLPEVAGASGALQLPCDDVDAYAIALNQALEDDAWCENYIQGGIERSKLFSWDKTVEATLGAYKLAMR